MAAARRAGSKQSVQWKQRTVKANHKLLAKEKKKKGSYATIQDHKNEGNATS